METTLYDRKGHATAYIADDGENSIYLWKGNAVAYIDNETVYGWIDHHLGWFLDGIVHDLQGRTAGFVRIKMPCGGLRRTGQIREVRETCEVRSICCARTSRP